MISAGEEQFSVTFPDGSHGFVKPLILADGAIELSISSEQQLDFPLGSSKPTDIHHPLPATREDWLALWDRLPPEAKQAFWKKIRENGGNFGGAEVPFVDINFTYHCLSQANVLPCSIDFFELWGEEIDEEDKKRQAKLVVPLPDLPDNDPATQLKKNLQNERNKLRTVAAKEVKSLKIWSGVSAFLTSLMVILGITATVGFIYLLATGVAFTAAAALVLTLPAAGVAFVIGLALVGGVLAFRLAYWLNRKPGTEDSKRLTKDLAAIEAKDFDLYEKEETSERRAQRYRLWNKIFLGIGIVLTIIGLAAIAVFPASGLVFLGVSVGAVAFALLAYFVQRRVDKHNERLAELQLRGNRCKHRFFRANRQSTTLEKLQSFDSRLTDLLKFSLNSDNLKKIKAIAMGINDALTQHVMRLGIRFGTSDLTLQVAYQVAEEAEKLQKQGNIELTGRFSSLLRQLQDGLKRRIKAFSETSGSGELYLKQEREKLLANKSEYFLAGISALIMGAVLGAATYAVVISVAAAFALPLVPFVPVLVGVVIGLSIALAMYSGMKKNIDSERAKLKATEITSDSLEGGETSDQGETQGCIPVKQNWFNGFCKNFGKVVTNPVFITTLIGIISFITAPYLSLPIAIVVACATVVALLTVNYFMEQKGLVLRERFHRLFKTFMDEHQGRAEQEKRSVELVQEISHASVADNMLDALMSTSQAAFSQSIVSGVLQVLSVGECPTFSAMQRSIADFLSSHKAELTPAIQNEFTRRLEFTVFGSSPNTYTTSDYQSQEVDAIADQQVRSLRYYAIPPQEIENSRKIPIVERFFHETRVSYEMTSGTQHVEIKRGDSLLYLPKHELTKASLYQIAFALKMMYGEQEITIDRMVSNFLAQGRKVSDELLQILGKNKDVNEENIRKLFLAACVILQVSVHNEPMAPQAKGLRELVKKLQDGWRQGNPLMPTRSRPNVYPFGTRLPTTEQTTARATGEADGGSGHGGGLRKRGALTSRSTVRRTTSSVRSVRSARVR